MGDGGTLGDGQARASARAVGAATTGAEWSMERSAALGCVQGAATSSSARLGSARVIENASAKDGFGGSGGSEKGAALALGRLLTPHPYPLSPPPLFTSSSTPPLINRLLHRAVPANPLSQTARRAAPKPNKRSAIM